MTEIYKTIEEKALAILKNLFIFQENIHNIRNFQIIANENKNTVRYGLETVCYKTPYWWASLREEYKHQNSAGKFKKKNKEMDVFTNYVSTTCIYQLCRTYEQNLGVFLFS